MQTILIFVLFAAALTYLGWRAYQRLMVKAGGCGKGCGCATDTASQLGKRPARTTGSGVHIR